MKRSRWATWCTTACLLPGPAYLGWCRDADRARVASAPGPGNSSPYYKQFFPNFSETTSGPAGRAEATDHHATLALPCATIDIVFKDERTPILDSFHDQVMNQWPGVHLRVTEAWDEDGHHPPGSLHYEGRAVDITTDDRETEKYGLLAQLAVEAGFDWVHYESKYHIHCSVKADHSVAVEKGGCFPGWARVTVAGGGQKSLSSLAPGDRVMALSGTGQVVFSQVILFLHRDQESWSTFLSLETEDGHRLALTPHHLVFLAPHCRSDSSEYQAQFASRAKAGDCVLIHAAEGPVRPSRIISVSVEESMGVYAPLTEAGTLFVDGVLASSYALVEHHRLAHWAFLPLRLLSSFNQLLWGEATKEQQMTDGQTGCTKTPFYCSTLATQDKTDLE
ncbi:desert hedgehog protein [Lates japonicus]|uniref:Desert hedgehog protein n=1 Tax=Lates japonicus TaxID=270547 RepID=A0AAD3QWJ2_LATJO|nr:desert hedgehog protein [Lates japonicus]